MLTEAFGPARLAFVHSSSPPASPGLQEAKCPARTPGIFAAYPDRGQSPAGSDGCWLGRSARSLPATGNAAAKPPSRNLRFQKTQTQSGDFHLPANTDPGTPPAPKPSLRNTNMWPPSLFGSTEEHFCLLSLLSFQLPLSRFPSKQQLPLGSW